MNPATYMDNVACGGLVPAALRAGPSWARAWWTADFTRDRGIEGYGAISDLAHASAQDVLTPAALDGECRS